ncbi:MAG: precorrin-4 C(11)-methyltransferase, partial [Bacteroides sp.]|nr:precorrin-4 C(11)-methyltransferase [Bacteroides sp.]
MKIIITISDSALPIARTIQREWLDVETIRMSSVSYLSECWDELECVVFIGALGICVRTIAPLLKDKYTDPAVVCVDSTGRWVIPVVSGHIGYANEYSKRIASILGAEAVITTQSDNLGLWALDTLAKTYGWQTEVDHTRMNLFIYQFVEKKPTALLLDVRDA